MNKQEPDDVDEVPVDRARPPAARGASQGNLAAAAPDRTRRQEHDPADHVRHVDARHHVEQRAERSVLHPEAELRVVVELQRQEHDPQRDRDAEPQRRRRAHRAAADRTAGQQDRDAARRPGSPSGSRRCRSSRCGMPAGGQTGALALIVKYAPKNAAKNMASEATNRTIPSTGPLIPRAATSLGDGRRRSSRVLLRRHRAGRSTGRSDRMGGSDRSCATGGGEVVAHSRVLRAPRVVRRGPRLAQRR